MPTLKDFALKHVCPHFVLDEWLRIQPDRRTLRPVKFPSNKDVTIKKNGIVVPKDGLFSGITVTGRRMSPFEIVSDENDEFRFSFNEGPVQKVFLPSGAEVSTSRIVEAINEQAQNIVANDANGRVQIETLQDGDEVTLFLKGGNAHEELGFPSHRFYHGQEVVPPWSVVKRRSAVESDAKQIQFQRRLNTNDDVFEVSYITRRRSCRRCRGLGVENDIRHTPQGDPEFVTGIDLLAQDVEKIIFTVKGSNIFYRWYGTSLVDLLGSKVVGADAISSQLINEIGETLERFRSLRSQQSKTQPVGDQEFLLRVSNISVQQDNLDPTIFRVQIDIQNRADQVDQLQRTISVNDLPDGVSGRQVT